MGRKRSNPFAARRVAKKQLKKDRDRAITQNKRMNTSRMMKKDAPRMHRGI